MNTQACHPIYRRLQGLFDVPTGPVPTDTFGSNDRLKRKIA